MVVGSGGRCSRASWLARRFAASPRCAPYRAHLYREYSIRVGRRLNAQGRNGSHFWVFSAMGKPPRNITTQPCALPYFKGPAARCRSPITSPIPPTESATTTA